MQFNKLPTSIKDQIELLEARGMLIPDAKSAAHYLQHVTYYRLRAYWLNCEEPCENGNHQFKPETNFKQVIDLYIFDRKLRLHVMDAIERIEVSIRGHWAHHLATTYGAHGYLDKQIYANVLKFDTGLDRLQRSIKESTDTFIEHYKTKYSSPEMPPIWMIVELMSFGELSKWYGNLMTRTDRQAIAKPFGLDQKILKSFLHHTTLIRNLCAHHGRLWNKQFTIQMTTPSSPASLAVALKGNVDPKRIYPALVTFAYLLRIIAPNSQWKSELVNLITSFDAVEPRHMGFPDKWQQMSFWKVKNS